MAFIGRELYMTTFTSFRRGKLGIAYIEGENSEFFLVPGYSCKKKAIDDDSYLALPSPRDYTGRGLGIFPSPRDFNT